jgi:hypothetical protein
MMILKKRSKLSIILIKIIDGKKIKIVITYYPHSINIHNVKDVELILFFNYIHFKISNVHKYFTTCKLGVYMYMTYKIKL